MPDPRRMNVSSDTSGTPTELSSAPLGNTEFAQPRPAAPFEHGHAALVPSPAQNEATNGERSVPSSVQLTSEPMSCSAQSRISSVHVPPVELAIELSPTLLPVAD